MIALLWANKCDNVDLKCIKKYFFLYSSIANKISDSQLGDFKLTLKGSNCTISILLLFPLMRDQILKVFLSST